MDARADARDGGGSARRAAQGAERAAAADAAADAVDALSPEQLAAAVPKRVALFVEPSPFTCARDAAALRQSHPHVRCAALCAH